MTGVAETGADPARSDRRWRVGSAALLLALAVVMLATFLDYGITGDEGVRHRYGRRLLRYYATLGADRAAVADVDISRDGGVFEITAGVIGFLSPLETYENRHLVVVLFALIGVAGVRGLARRLSGEAAGFLAVLFLAFTPPFYGHAFNNSKDVPFATLFVLAAWAVLRTVDDGLPPRISRVLIAAIAVGLVAGERVAGLVFLGYAPVLWIGNLYAASRTSDSSPKPSRRDLARLLKPALVLAGAAWTVMLAFWPWAQTRPFRNPIQALQMFSNFWDCMVVFFDGELVCSGQVTRFYLPTWFALTLPETYLVAAVLGGLALARSLTRWPLSTCGRTGLLEASWLLLVVAFPVTWAVVMHTPLYDGLRHFLFVMPVLAVLAGMSVAAYLRTRGGAIETAAAGIALAGTLGATLVDMTQLHPYESVYFNRLVAGGLEHAITRYEGDYWCLSYREGIEWLKERYEGARCDEPVRVAGNSIFQQTAYYVRQTEPSERVLRATDGKGDPHFILATTRHGDHRNTPGTLVHQVKRQHAALLYIFQVKAPSCAPPPVRDGDASP